MSRRARAGALCCAVAALWATTGCTGGSDSPAAEPTSVAPTVAPTTRAVAPAQTPDPSAVPASGSRRRSGPLSLVLPASFEPTGQTGNDSLSLLQFTSSEPQAIVEISRTASSSDDLDTTAKAAIADSPLAPTRLADRDVGGQQVYAVSGSDDYTGLYYAIGRSVAGQRVDVAFSFQLDSPANHALIESVLASARWRD